MFNRRVISFNLRELLQISCFNPKIGKGCRHKVKSCLGSTGYQWEPANFLGGNLCSQGAIENRPDPLFCREPGFQGTSEKETGLNRPERIHSHTRSCFFGPGECYGRLRLSTPPLYPPPHPFKPHKKLNMKWGKCWRRDPDLNICHAQANLVPWLRWMPGFLLLPNEMIAVGVCDRWRPVTSLHNIKDPYLTER